ncbi:elongator complex protein 5 [Gigaspora margarita]|uniref:Elongator complex protein 5 n=1 Tax=Gigaspora margarita TaxID=4874 RepID=A0A8H4ADB8_GIGMA|nr:elongator complex protein 5 [Gigaspora margarita]
MSVPLLDRLLNFKESSGFIVIEDTILQSGYLLLKEFVKKITENNKQNVIIFCVESSPQYFLESVKSNKNVIFLDAYSHLGSYESDDMDDIGNNDTKVHIIKSLDDLSIILRLIQDIIAKSSNSNFTLIIDSLTPLLLTSISSTFSFLKKISSELTSEMNTFRAIAVYHSDIPTYPVNGITGMLNIRNTILNHFATTTITIKNMEQTRKESIYEYSKGTDTMINVHMNSPECSICVIEHRKKSGKVFYERNVYNIDQSTNDLIIQFAKEITDDINAKDNNNPDPTIANMSFNLSLTEEQKKAKNDVILPYTKVQGIYIFVM